ncbi:MAG: RnfABCDGE type electron transport complex subunit B [Bacteroidales bacterium]|jgi:RnfABCDGE-type electron transport complex B subunit|nr:RnfABCDGE type electron transport complex subunit B [Bacteroidales bacterium]
MNVILIALIALGAIGLIGSLLLCLVAKKFYVYEDPRVGQVEEVLPGANCGGCGFPGCHGMADACVKAKDSSNSLGSLLCPVGGNEVMAKVADILGLEAGAAEPKVAVVRCNGNICARPKVAVFDGAKSCAIASATFSGETGCVFGCLGLGDCVKACQFNAIRMNAETGLPEVDEEKCVACGACAKACPKFVIEVRKKSAMKSPMPKRVWVDCVNKDKGAVARKACSNACIGCGKCQKVCKFDAITVENNVAFIDSEKCKACGMCVSECPTGAIHATEPVMIVVEKLKAKKAEAAAKAKEEAAKKAAEAKAAADAAAATPAEPASENKQEAPKSGEQ